MKKAFPNVDIEGHNLPPSPAPSSPYGQQRRYALATELVYTEGSDQYNASSVPIYQVRDFFFFWKGIGVADGGRWDLDCHVQAIVRLRRQRV